MATRNRPTASKAAAPIDTDAWVPRFRAKVKQATPSGWTVCKDRGDRMRLQLRTNGTSEGVALPYAWNDDDADEALQRIKVIAKIHTAGGVSLKEAARQADTTIVTEAVDVPWAEAIAKFRTFKAGVGEKTWRSKYEPVFTKMLAALEKRNAPTNGPDLVDTALSGWKAGSRQRQVQRQSISSFLRYCVERLNYKSCWLPPEASTVQAETYTKSRDGYPLSDAQILRLLEWLQENKTTIRDKRWVFAIQLAAVYGLRPEDLRYLTTKRGGQELWSEYQKSQGGTKGTRTEKRRLFPLFVADLDGQPIQWNLMQRLHIGEQLPPLGSAGSAGEAFGRYLNRQPIWQQLKLEAASEGEVLTPYSFRHRYSYVGHNRPQSDGTMRAPKQIADAMGHSLEVHLKSYAKFMTKDLADAFDSEIAPTAPAATTTVRR